MKRLTCRMATLMLAAGMLLLSAAAYAGEPVSQTREVAGFDRIEINGAYDLFLTQGQEYSLRIEADPEVLQNIQTEVKDGRLVVSDKKPRIRIGVSKSKSRRIYLVLPQLKDLCINGAADVVGQNRIKTGNFNLTVNGAGDVDLELEAGDVATSISGAGDIKFKGTANNFDVSIEGAGDISAFELASQRARVKISGSGDCKVNAGQELTVSIAGSGDVRYRGSPKVTMSSVGGVGSVHKE